MEPRKSSGPSFETCGRRRYGNVVTGFQSEWRESVLHSAAKVDVVKAPQLEAAGKLLGIAVRDVTATINHPIPINYEQVGGEGSAAALHNID